MIIFNKLFILLVKLNNRFIITAAIGLIMLSSYLIYLLEPKTFENPFNGLWWVMTTVTTVGYGDYYPHTVAGKCLGIFLYIFGIGFISIIISKVIDTIFSFNRMKEEGKLNYKKENHFVMIDWSNHAGLAIHEILDTDPEVEIVIIDQLEKTPFNHERVHYIQGSPMVKETYDRANLSRARAVFIFANEMTSYQNFIRDTSFVDGKTLLIATLIERCFGNVYTIVEIRDKANAANFLHVKVDEFILSSETVPLMAVRAAFTPGASKLVSQLLTRQHGEDLFQIRKKSHWVTYRDAFNELLEEGATLLADGEHMNINRRLDEVIPDEARLFVVCDKRTHAKFMNA